MVRRIENVAALHGGGHVQVMLDQEVDLGGFVFGELQAAGGALKSFQAARDMILDVHAFADVVQEERQNKQVAAINGLATAVQNERLARREESANSCKCSMVRSECSSTV